MVFGFVLGSNCFIGSLFFVIIAVFKVSVLWEVHDLLLMLNNAVFLHCCFFFCSPPEMNVCFIKHQQIRQLMEAHFQQLTEKTRSTHHIKYTKLKDWDTSFCGFVELLSQRTEILERLELPTQNNILDQTQCPEAWTHRCTVRIQVQSKSFYSVQKGRSLTGSEVNQGKHVQGNTQGIIGCNIRREDEDDARLQNKTELDEDTDRNLDNNGSLSLSGPDT